MEWLQFSYYSIGSLTGFILSFLLTTYLLIIEKSAQSRYLAGFFLGLFIFMGGTFLKHSIYAPWGAYASSYLTNISIFHVIPFMQFAYHFPHNLYPKESKRAYIVSIVIITLGFVIYLGQIWNNPAIYLPSLYSYTFWGGGMQVLPVLLVIAYFWIGLVLIRKIIKLSTYDGALTTWLQTPQSNNIVALLRFVFAYVLVAVLKIIRPQGKEAKSIQLLTILSLIIFVGTGFNVFAQTGFFSREIIYAIFISALLITLLSFLLIYLNYSTEPTSFMVKLLGISLCTILIIVGISSTVTLLFVEQTFAQHRLLEVTHIHREFKDTSDTIDHLYEYVTTEFVDVAYVAFYSVTQASQSSFLHQQTFSNYTDIASTPLEFELSTSEESIQTGFRKINDEHYQTYFFVEEDILYEIGYNLRIYRAYIHQAAIPLIIIIVVTTFIILTIFPLFFQISLVKPLNDLLLGVKEVNLGNLDVTVPVKNEDEIGFLTRSFNAMAQSIKQSIATREKLLTMQQELDIAHQIQKNLLPPSHPGWRNPDMYCYSIPAREVGGDFYIYHRFNRNTVALAIGDVAGKGMPAALLMAVSIASLRVLLDSKLNPSRLLEKLNHALSYHIQSTQQNCALCCAVLQGKTLTVANAGCVIPLLRRADGSVSWIEAFGLPLGVITVTGFNYEEHTINLSSGDLVVFTSDGVIEATNMRGELFSFDRLEEAVITGPSSSAGDMMEHLEEVIANFVGGAEQHDDLTIMVLRIR